MRDEERKNWNCCSGRNDKVGIKRYQGKQTNLRGRKVAGHGGHASCFEASKVQFYGTSVHASRRSCEREKVTKKELRVKYVVRPIYDGAIKAKARSHL